MLRYEILYRFREAGLMHLIDRMRFLFNQLRYYRKNKNFIRSNPDLKLPPPYLIYESFTLDYQSYYKDGLENAQWLKTVLSEYINFSNNNILDWGCGPARVVRHLPFVITENCKIYATDYNLQTIKWCRNNIEKVSFSHNKVEPPLSFNDNFFDVVYGFSVFTHLSEKNHWTWINELYRIIRPGGILLITTQGAIFKEKLTSKEKAIYLEGNLVERSKVKEGHRTFSAFHPVEYMEKLFLNRWNVLKFIEGEKQNWGYEQDAWLLQKV
jgi:SAM-dependent methyltransferase